MTEHPLTRKEFREDILPHLATKTDLAELETRLIKWMVGLMVGSVIAASSVALLVQRLLAS